MPSYYEVTTSLMYLCFVTKQVDFAIVEVGCGGLLDGTNVTNNPKYCVITKQGYDHLEIVGETMTEITRNDAGIITPDSTVISLQHEEQVCNNIIDHRYKKQNAKKIVFDPQTHLHNIEYKTDKTLFEYTHKFITHNSQPVTHNPHFSTNLLGPFHLENLGLALTAFFTICNQEDISCEILDAKTLVTNNQQLITTLQSLHRKGRFDLIQYIPPDKVSNECPPDKGALKEVPLGWGRGVNLLLDGAHNPQKMQALIDTLDIIYSQHFSSSTVQPFSFYISFKQGKQRQEMLDIIIPHAQKIIIGDFMTVQDFKLHSVPAQEILDYLVQQGYNNAHIDTDPLHVIEQYQDTKIPLIITGSLYFLSCIYNKLGL